MGRAAYRNTTLNTSHPSVCPYRDSPPGGVAVVLVDVAAADEEEQDGSDERQTGTYRQESPGRVRQERVPRQLVAEETQRAQHLPETETGLDTYT